MEEREYILVTDINGRVLRTAEIRKGILTPETIGDDTLNDNQAEEVICLNIYKEELLIIKDPLSMHPFDELPSRVRTLVDEKKRKKETRTKP
jgi:hypothetical protein